MADLAVMRRQCVDGLLAGGRPDILLLDGYKQVGLFGGALAAHGLAMGRDIEVLADGEMCSGTIFLQSDYIGLSVEILRLISGLAVAPGRPLGRVVLPGFIKRTPMRIGDLRPLRQQEGRRHGKLS